MQSKFNVKSGYMFCDISYNVWVTDMQFWLSSEHCSLLRGTRPLHTSCFTEKSEILLLLKIYQSIKTLGMNFRPSWEQKGSREAKLPSRSCREGDCARNMKAWLFMAVPEWLWTKHHYPVQELTDLHKMPPHHTTAM